MEADLEAAVERGVLFLDKLCPEGWAHRIDIGALDMYYPKLCICGQLFGYYGRGPKGTLFASSKRKRSPEYLGFDVDIEVPTVKDYAELTKAWRKRLQESNG